MHEEAPEQIAEAHVKLSGAWTEGYCPGSVDTQRSGVSDAEETSRSHPHRTHLNSAESRLNLEMVRAGRYRRRRKPRERIFAPSAQTIA